MSFDRHDLGEKLQGLAAKLSSAWPSTPRCSKLFALMPPIRQVRAAESSAVEMLRQIQFLEQFAAACALADDAGSARFLSSSALTVAVSNTVGAAHLRSCLPDADRTLSSELCTEPL